MRLASFNILLVFSKSFMPSFRSFSFPSPTSHSSPPCCDVVSTFHTKILCFIGTDSVYAKVDDIYVL